MKCKIAALLPTGHHKNVSVQTSVTVNSKLVHDLPLLDMHSDLHVLPNPMLFHSQQECGRSLHPQQQKIRTTETSKQSSKSGFAVLLIWKRKQCLSKGLFPSIHQRGFMRSSKLCISVNFIRGVLVTLSTMLHCSFQGNDEQKY